MCDFQIRRPTVNLVISNPWLGSTDDGWVKDPLNGNSDYCYQIMDSDKGEVNWKSAVDQCRGKGGDLVSIENQAEQDAIEKMLSDKYKKTSVELWIGLEVGFLSPKI